MINATTVWRPVLAASRENCPGRGKYKGPRIRAPPGAMGGCMGKHGM